MVFVNLISSIKIVFEKISTLKWSPCFLIIFNDRSISISECIISFTKGYCSKSLILALFASIGSLNDNLDDNDSLAVEDEKSVKFDCNSNFWIKISMSTKTCNLFFCIIIL